MLITQKAEYIWSSKQDRYILLRKQSINWTGLVAFAKGASAQQNALAQQQSNFYSTLQQDYGTQFKDQSNILGTLTKSLSPILQGGVNQFGFSQGETNALNSSAIQNTGTQYANQAKALRENQAAQGGGNALLPSGVAQQQQAALGAASADQASNQLLGIQQAGYAQGRQNYNNAVGQLGGVAGQYNPSGFSSAANSAGSNAANTAGQIAQENNAASPWNLVGGILGGAAQGFGGALSGGLGTAVSKMGSGNWGW